MDLQNRRASLRPTLSLRCRRAASLAALLSACAPAGPGEVPPLPSDGGAAPIRTDRGVYPLRRNVPPNGHAEAVIVATYRNRTADTVYLSVCQKTPPRYRLEKKVEGEWIRAYEPVCHLVAPQRLPSVAPGEARTDTLHVRHHSPGMPAFSVEEIPGTYRLVYEAYAHWSMDTPGRTPLPGDAVVSNEFQIR